MKKFGTQHSNLKKALIVNGGLVLIVCLYYLLLNLTGISCPLKFILGFNCPTCNSTTAVLTLLKGDFLGYLKLQPFSIPLGIAVLLEVNRFLFKKPLAIDIYAVTVAVGNFIYYIIVNFIL